MPRNIALSTLVGEYWRLLPYIQYIYIYILFFFSNLYYSACSHISLPWSAQEVSLVYRVRTAEGGCHHCLCSLHYPLISPEAAAEIKNIGVTGTRLSCVSFPIALFDVMGNCCHSPHMYIAVDVLADKRFNLTLRRFLIKGSNHYSKRKTGDIDITGKWICRNCILLM